MLLAGGVAALVVPTHPVTDWRPLLVLGGVVLALSSVAAELPFATSISMAYAALFAALVYSGPVGAGFVGCLCAFSLQEVREHKPALLIIGNGAQIALACMIAGLVYESIGGHLLQLGPPADVTVGSGLLAPLAATTVFFACNLVLVGVGVALKTGMSAKMTIRALEPAAYWVSLVVLALLGYVMAHLMSLSSWLGVLLLVLPFLAARRTFRVYVELSEAYASTVRSLVTAIEAKDPYTRGHSERVAVYTRRLGDHLGLPRAQLDLLERAALLHDVGKIGIELDTLSSPMQLSAEEVRLIRRHPVLGSELVSDVEFLADIVPVIRHHHERYDGAGYPDGLAGVDIPLLARVMAVADSYDAMTSNRAYRPAMTQEQAIVEIERVAGTQLDRNMALQFTSMLADGQEVGMPHEA
ncbi:MAG: HD-GYP domain-containing protein [Coriobacteriia bacterium]|nr:HD-GYP domain-containing protein [Coriobacteriia bacterium]